MLNEQSEELGLKHTLCRVPCTDPLFNFNNPIR